MVLTHHDIGTETKPTLYDSAKDGSYVLYSKHVRTDYENKIVTHQHSAELKIRHERGKRLKHDRVDTKQTKLPTPGLTARHTSP